MKVKPRTCANDIHDSQVVDFVVVGMLHVEKPDIEKTE